jgi:type I restriction-modification system DNA methylase subunit
MSNKKMDHYALLTKSFEKLALTNSRYPAFCKIVDFSLHALNAIADLPAFHQFIADIPNEEQKQLLEIFQTIGEIADNDGEGFKDPFGDLFMEYISNDKNGQFFTPESLCDLKAQMTCPDLQKGQTVSDPACGSGRNLLAAAKIEREAIFYAADIDLLCTKMTVINYMLNCMVGEVVQMDSILMKFFTGFKVDKFYHFGKYLPYYKVITSEQSVLSAKLPILTPKTAPTKLPKVNADNFLDTIQLTLF